MFIYEQYQMEYADSFLEACIDYHDTINCYIFEVDIAYSFFGW